MMHRFLCESIKGGCAVLRGEEHEHLRRVLRLEPGQAVELITPDGAYAATLEAVEAKESLARIERALPSREARCRITVYQCLPKADRYESALQKGVELGVAAFVPVLSSRCVARVDSDPGKKLERWRRIVREAVKQSGRTAIPQVAEPMSWEAAVAHVHELKIVPWEEARDGDLRGTLETCPSARDVALYIGPEGGITPEEIECAVQNGARVATLGPRILRTDTAGIAAAAAILYAYGDLGEADENR